jgi:hypothetical protein
MNNETINKLRVYKYLLSKDTLTKKEFDMIVELSCWANENKVSCDMLNEYPEVKNGR